MQTIDERVEATEAHEDTRASITRGEPQSPVIEPSRSLAGIGIAALLIALLAFLVGLIALVVTASDRSSGDGSLAPVATISVALSDFKIANASGPVPAGRVRLAVHNNGPSEHNLKVEGVAETKKLKAGADAQLDLGTLDTGTYTWLCTVPGHKEAGMTGTFAVGQGAETTAGAGDQPDAAKIDAAHERVVKSFLSGPPARTAGLGNQVLAPKIEGGVKVFDLTARTVQWEVAPGRHYEAWTYNGTVPGPMLRVRQGETVKVRLHNQLPQSTSIHFHGVEVDDNKQDGVTYVTQDPIRPGETYEYTLTPINCGSHMYHSHHAADAQVPLGLLGAFVVECTTTAVPADYGHDSEYTEILTDGPLGFGINGKGFPATMPIVAKPGERTLVRFMNEGLIIHPMHLHGHRMTVVAKDGNFLTPYEVDTLNVAPGERYDVIVTSLHAGAWAFHCHILTHAESSEGLHGMTTVWVVKP